MSMPDRADVSSLHRPDPTYPTSEPLSGSAAAPSTAPPTHPLAAPSERWVTIMHATEIVGVSRRTIYNWINNGKVEYTRTAGGCVRINPATLWRTSPSSQRSE